MKKNIVKANIIKAVLYVIIGVVTAIASGIGILIMYFSSTFLPVYVGKTYVVGNQITRYLLYLILILMIFFSAKLAEYGMSYFIKRFHKTKRC